LFEGGIKKQVLTLVSISTAAIFRLMLIKKVWLHSCPAPEMERKKLFQILL